MTEEELVKKAAEAISMANVSCGGVCPDPTRYYSDLRIAVSVILKEFEKNEPVATFDSRRRTPEGTKEFFGWMLSDDNPSKGAKLYTSPFVYADKSKISLIDRCRKAEDRAEQLREELEKQKREKMW